ncbi:hypothetical protein SUGI_1073700 [Cryptomeria japonica]|nr:hypothetical protein SUGI_1073700 [Cryptomeria japonica]
MTDGWTDRRNRTLLNFLVSSAGGTVFIKSIDASAHCKNATYLCEQIEEVINEVGEENVVQVVTDNAPNYVAAGRLLMERRPSIVWTPLKFVKPLTGAIFGNNLEAKFVDINQDLVCVNVIGRSDANENLLPESPKSLAIRQIKELSDECQRKILERYFFDNHVPVFRNDGWGDLQIVLENAKKIRDKLRKRKSIQIEHKRKTLADSSRIRSLSNEKSLEPIYVEQKDSMCLTSSKHNGASYSQDNDESDDDIFGKEMLLDKAKEINHDEDHSKEICVPLKSEDDERYFHDKKSFSQGQDVYKESFVDTGEEVFEKDSSKNERVVVEKERIVDQHIDDLKNVGKQGFLRIECKEIRISSKVCTSFQQKREEMIQR